MAAGSWVRVGFVLALGLAGSLSLSAQTPPATPEWVGQVRDLVERLHRVPLDPQAAYHVRELYLRRNALRMELTDGTLIFFQPVEGKVTGALFVGEGRLLVMPPMVSERRQLVRFTGFPILAEPFTSAYLRFTDETDTELRALSASGRGTRVDPSELMAQWAGMVQALNPSHSLRVLTDLLSPNPQPYFYAGLSNPRLGFFDVLLDDRLDEEVQIGQAHWRDDRMHFNIWCSFPREARRPTARPRAEVATFRIRTTIEHDHTLEGTTEVSLRFEAAGERVHVFELSRFLQVKDVTDGTGQPLAFFQNEPLALEQLAAYGNDLVVVVLPPGWVPNQPYSLRFQYRGQVITDRGNGVLQVGARGIWYPSLLPPRAAPFTMDFRYPRALTLIASGERLSETEEGPWRLSRWVSAVPIVFAGFNLGAYESTERVHNGILISVHANRQLEPELARPLTPTPIPLTNPQLEGGRVARVEELLRRGPDLMAALANVAPQPAARVEQVGEEIARALDFFTSQFGRFPYPRLSVSQMPEALGEGYPGLLYLSTFTFLSGREQSRLGLSARSREHFSGLVPAHETAHQWWGNHVQVANYRDQWLVEALTTYSTLLYLEHKPGGDRELRQWLNHYRNDLLAKGPSKEPWESTGPLTLGRRLNSSHTTDGYERVIYPKGAWVVHMLRHLLGEKAFSDLLRNIVAEYGNKPFSTAALQALAERRMSSERNVEATNRLDWFFEQWVHNTGIPHYQLRARVEPRPNGSYRIRGSITQRGVVDLFAMPVPVYARMGKDLRFLGRVAVSGPETSFTFITSTRPERILLDPHQTVLCVIE